MRWLPRTLFGRLVFILLAGLLTSQVISTLILFQERHQAIYRAGGIQAAHRLAGMVQLLDRLDREQRKQFIRVLQSRIFRVRLQPVYQPETRIKPGNKDSSRFFTRVLQQLLGNRPMQIVVRQQPRRRRPFPRPPRPGQPGNPMADRMRSMMPYYRPEVEALRDSRVALFANIRLQDGAGLRIQQQLRGDSIQWPMRSLAALLVLVLSVIVIALIAVRLATRPLSVLAKAAENLGRNINQPPLPVQGPQEVRQASSAFNTMQQRIQQQIREHSEMMAAISHDLKTPITRMRLRAEFLDDSSVGDKFRQDLADMEKMVRAALDFMRGTAHQETQVRIDIQALLESLQDDYQDQGQIVQLEKQPVAEYPGQLLSLKRVLTNLLDNALSYGHSATVSCKDNPETLIIFIDDDGPGVPEDQLEHLFDPFYRAEGSRNRATGGTGLGLGIARQLVTAHGGTLTLANRTKGGLRAKIVLPRIPQIKA
ncbi:MAG TPA: HAMP domain-containing protein [Gammaproteobacteria bacterium]|nr:HAMP domain-containing protein [Gammaproteobacteria bacterium]